MSQVWVLWYEYSDRSGAAVLRAYDSETRAQYDLDLLSDVQDGRKYQIEALPVYSMREECDDAA